MAHPAQSVPRYQFGVFTVDIRSGELRKQGTRVKLQERPFQLLVALVERPGEVVTREELRQRLWSDGTYVDFEHSISSSVNKLRSALNDSATHPRYIETVGRRGYRFLYPVTAAGPPPGPHTVPAPVGEPFHRRNWALLIAVLVLAGVLASAAGLSWFRRPVAGGPIRSIAVLPLKNLSSDPEQEYFSEGLTDELITRLASLRGLRIISRTSVMQYKDTRKPLPEIARELRVDAVLEGSVLRSGGRVRITAQLIAAASDRHLWAESYERDQRDILDLQDEVTRDIVQNIKLSLNPADQQRLAASSPVDPEAHDLYLKGLYFWNKRTPEGLQKAVEYFQQAIAKDPNYARAYAGLADSYALISTYGLARAAELVPKARAAALRALELDERLAEAHTSLALISEFYDWDWQAAEKGYRRAIQLDPNYATAHQWYAEFLAFQGRFDEAFAESDRARRADPLSLVIATDYAAILYFSRQYDAAIAQFRAVQAVEPHFTRAHMVVNAYAEKGMYAEALAEVRNWRRMDDTPWTWVDEAHVYGRMGRQAQAQQTLKGLEQATRGRQVDTTGMFAVAYAVVNDKEKALACLEKGYREHSNVLARLKVDPAYDSLRSAPRFQELMRRVGLAQ